MRRAAAALLLLFCSSSALADFGRVVRTVERTTGARRTYIPFLGVARMFVRVIEPEGISDVRVAVFEGRRRSLPAHFPETIEAAVGPRWHPVVRSYSRRDGEQALIFVRESRERLRMLIVALERDGSAIVEVEIDPRRFAHFLAQASSGGPVFRW